MLNKLLKLIYKLVAVTKGKKRKSEAGAEVWFVS